MDARDGFSAQGSDYHEIPILNVSKAARLSMVLSIKKLLDYDVHCQFEDFQIRDFVLIEAFA